MQSSQRYGAYHPETLVNDFGRGIAPPDYRERRPARLHRACHLCLEPISLELGLRRRLEGDNAERTAMCHLYSQGMVDEI